MINEANYKLILTRQELDEIRKLEEKGMSRGLSYKIDPGIDSGILCTRNGVLTGFMTVDCFGGKDIESAAITDNMADWDAMKAALTAYAVENEAEQILFICNPKDKKVSRRLRSCGLRPEFSEYRMVFDRSAFAPAAITDITLRQAVASDTTYLKTLDQDVFGRNLTHISPQDLRNTQIILQDDRPAGKFRVEESEGIYGIYGVIVEPEFRGRGIGAQALTLLLQRLIELEAETVYLEVESQNPVAYHLYLKLGFKVVSEFCYYPYKL